MSTIDPQKIWQSFYAGLAFLIVTVAFFYLTQPDEDGGTPRWRRWVARYVMSRDEGHARRARSVQNQPEMAGSSVEPEPEPVPNPASESRTPLGTGAFVLNDDQCRAVTKMIYHKASNPSATKASTIKAGFDVSKGESSRYQEASAIYDALFVLPKPPEPPKYPHRTSEQSKLREALQLDKA